MQQPAVALVIDPDRVARSLAMNGLRTLSLSPIGFDSIDAALAWLANNRPPALVSVDVWLGTSAMRFCRALRQDARTSTVPVIVLTTHARPEDRARALELGCAFMTKPFRVGDYVAAARHLVGGRVNVLPNAAVAS